MKKSYLRTGLALALALGLAACGGDDDGDLQLGVALSGITKSGLTLKNNGGADIAVAPGTFFVFPDLVAVDSQYDITIGLKPDNTVADSCRVINGKGKVSTISPRNIAVVCDIKTYELGGTVEGLALEGGLIINNGSQQKAIPKGATTFTMTTAATETAKFPGQVAEGTPYAVTILSPAAGSHNCRVENGVGVMPAAAVNNIKIICT